MIRAHPVYAYVQLKRNMASSNNSVFHVVANVDIEDEEFEISAPKCLQGYSERSTDHVHSKI
jgi:hypothetical protein